MERVIIRLFGVNLNGVDVKDIVVIEEIVVCIVKGFNFLISLN